MNRVITSVMVPPLSLCVHTNIQHCPSREIQFGNLAQKYSWEIQLKKKRLRNTGMVPPLSLCVHTNIQHCPSSSQLRNTAGKYIWETQLRNTFKKEGNNNKIT